MVEHFGYWITHARTVGAVIGKMMGGLYPGIDVVVGRDPVANANLSRNFAHAHQVELERRPAIEQADLIFAHEVSGHVAGTGQPINPHALLYLSAAPDKQRVIFNNGAPPQNQTWADLARNVQAARALLRK